MDKHEKRQRLIAMRECLRQAQKLLATKYEGHCLLDGEQFICSAIKKTNCDHTVTTDAQAYVYKALQGEYVFESIMRKLNPGRSFSFEEIMQLRRRFIDDLCHRINQELGKLA